ncbi:MAG: response regulator transcription factor [Bdellovibrionaceae bacterium]|nr:response regulator transcription factor [Pseudobdellovibrionaceae bacterium]
MDIQRILIIEDSVDLQFELKEILQKKFSITGVLTAAAALDALNASQYSLILIDVGLPDEDGFTLLGKIRQIDTAKLTPVFFLTGRDNVQDKVNAFSMGADDYLVKPFNPRELEARVEAKMLKLLAQPIQGDSFVCGNFRVAPGLQKVEVLADETGHLTPERNMNLTSIEFRLLFYFLKNEDKNLPRKEILKVVWGESLPGTDRTVDTHVYTLRQKLGSLARCVKSVPKVGYRFSQKDVSRAKKTG